MSRELTIRVDSATSHQIADFLRGCDPVFVSELSRRVVIEEYAVKLAEKAVRWEAWCGDRLVGMAAIYCNDFKERAAFITSNARGATRPSRSAMSPKRDKPGTKLQGQ